MLATIKCSYPLSTYKDNTLLTTFPMVLCIPTTYYMIQPMFPEL